MKVLFTVPPLAGHVNPTVAVGSEMAARGHEVAWTGPAGALSRLLPEHARILPAGEEAGGGYEALHARWRDLRGVGALRFLWEEALVPLARSMVPGVRRAVHTFGPDVLVADQQALAGPLVARELAVPWATSASTSAELTRPFAEFPKIGEWVAAQIGGLLADCGAVGEAGGPEWDPRFSDRLVLVFSSRELVGGAQDFPPHYAFVGPAFGARPPAPGFPWERLDPARRRVLVSLGTLNQEAGGRFYGAVLGAAERLSGEVQLVMVAPASLVAAAPGTYCCATACRSWSCCRIWTRWSATAGTTRSARPSHTGCPWWSRRSATTSRSSRVRSWKPGPVCGCGSPGPGPRSCATH